jgi:hypothetical protein
MDSMRAAARWLSVVCVCLVCCFPGYTPAQVSGTGAISGQVLEADGKTPLRNASVRAGIASGEWYEQWANADVQGRYLIADLPVGQYRVTATAPGHVNQMFERAMVCGAERVVKVNAGDTVGAIDFYLEKGGSVAGHVYDAETGEPLADIWVDGGAEGKCDIWGGAATGSDGSYVIAGVFPSGRCSLYAPSSWQATPYIRDPDSVRTVVVYAPDTTQGIDFYLHRGGSISGRVRSADGSGVGQQVPVSAWPKNGAWSRATWARMGDVYVLPGLPSGQYVVGVSPHLDPTKFHAEYYDDVPRWREFTPVRVNAPDTTSGVDITLSPVVVDSASNQFVKVVVSDRYPGSSLSIGNTGGLPDTRADDGKDLLFGHPSPHTSFSTIQLDGQDYVFGSPEGDLVSAPQRSTDGKSITRVWRIRNLRVAQVVSLVESSWSEHHFEDTAEIRYTMSNDDTRIHYVGLRILLDTMLGDNDGAPIKAYTDYRETERSYERQLWPGIPPWWVAMEGNPSNPGFEAQGTLTQGQATEPDRFAISAWTEISRTTWGYQVGAGRTITKDSAVAMWWNPRAVKPDSSLEIVTYYGLGRGFVRPGPPETSQVLPLPDAVDVPVSTPIVLHITDSTGVDQSSVQMTVNGDSVQPRIEEDPQQGVKDLLVTYEPEKPFPPVDGFRPNQEVTVTVTAKDLDWVPNTMERTIVFHRERDKVPPSVVDRHPPPGAAGVPRNERIIVRLQDNLAGVMLDSLLMLVNGEPVQLRITGGPLSRVMIYTPSVPYPWGTTVQVEVRAQDWAWPPNVMVPDVFSFTARVLPRPRLDVPARSLLFETEKSGTSVQQSLMLSNSGDTTLHVSRIAVVGPDSSRFRVAPAAATIAPGSSRTITVTFTQGLAAAKVGAIVLSHDAPDSLTRIELRAPGSILDLSVPRAKGMRRSVVVVPVSVVEAEGIAGGHLTLLYDPAVLRITRVKGTEMVDGAGMAMVSNLAEAGAVEVVMAGVRGLAAGAGALLQAEFEIKESAPLGGTPVRLRAELVDVTGAVYTTKVTEGLVLVGLLGDVNEDGQVNAGDVVLVLRYSVGLVDLGESQKEKGDVNGDGVTNTLDAILMLRRLAKIITRFPAEGTSKLVRGDAAARLYLGQATRTRLPGDAGGRVSVPLVLGVGAGGADLRLGYDRRRTQFVGVSAPGEVWLASDTLHSGEVHLVAARSDASSSQELWVELSGDGDGSELTLAGDVYGAEGELVSTVVDRCALPTGATLHGYPNPFNAVTTLAYTLAEDGHVRLRIHDVSGAEVQRLVWGWQARGRYAVVWDGRDAEGRAVASGVYLVCLDVKGSRQVQKLVLLK